MFCSLLFVTNGLESPKLLVKKGKYLEAKAVLNNIALLNGRDIFIEQLIGEEKDEFYQIDNSSPLNSNEENL